MAAPILAKPITIRDIEEMEARGIVREIVHGQWVNGAAHGMTGEVVVYSEDGSAQTHELGQTVSGADLLPGFALPVSTIFATYILCRESSEHPEAA